MKIVSFKRVGSNLFHRLPTKNSFCTFHLEWSFILLQEKNSASIGTFGAFEWKINLIECLRSEYIANRIRDLKYGPCTIMLIFTKKTSSWHKSTRRDRGYCHPFISWLGLCTYKWHYEISSSENIFPKLLFKVSLPGNGYFACTDTFDCEFPQKSDGSAWNAGDLGLPLGNQIRK